MSYILDIEVYLEKQVNINDDLENAIVEVFKLKHIVFNNEKIVDERFPKEIDYLRINCLNNNNEEMFGVLNFDLISHINFFPVFLEVGTSSEELLDEGDEATPVSHNWTLPCLELDGAWESLFFGDNTKQRLLQYGITSLRLGSHGVDPNIILCNRLILLHGPPGTGKTTITKALAQKLSIRLSKTYRYTQFIEVNCHSLFSKWFSESGKLVSKMFSSIRNFAQDPEILVVILIDEVESLTAARQSAINGNEPSDAIRVVNAVLTQLDKLRFLPNVLVVATSNLTEAIDSAFTDRADLIQFVGPPELHEANLILQSCISELIRAGVVLKTDSEPLDTNLIARRCLGLSGRVIRKLPVIALAEQPEFVVSDQLIHNLMCRAVDRLIEGRKFIKTE